MQELVIELPKLLQNKTAKRYTFNDTGLTIEDYAKHNQIIEVPIHAIQSFRFGVNWIRGSHFVIGRQYFLELRDGENYIVSIKFSSYYGIRKKNYHEIYLKIINVVWEHYFTYQLNYYADLYRDGESFSLSDIYFAAEGIRWNNILLPWKDVGISSYTTYFVIFNNNDKKINKSFRYITDWNAYLLKALLEGIVKGLKSSVDEY
jgi:hypothetical protein